MTMYGFAWLCIAIYVRSQGRQINMSWTNGPCIKMFQIRLWSYLTRYAIKKQCTTLWDENKMKESAKSKKLQPII